MARYLIASEEGADFHTRETGEPAELGAQVELKLDTDRERALLAAGWLEHITTKEKK